MRVAHISVSTVPVLHRFGGAVQRRVLELARAQTHAGHEVLVFSPGDRYGMTLHEGFTVVSIPCRTRHPARALEFLARISAWLSRAPRTDVLHYHSHPDGAVASLRLPGKKILSYDYFRFHGGRGFPIHTLTRHALLQFDALLPCSDYCRDESLAYWHLPPSKTRVLYNGVNTAQFQPDPVAGQAERTALGIDGRVILYVGRLNEQKGTDLLLDAVSRIRQRHPDACLVLAGPVQEFASGLSGHNWLRRIEAVGGRYLGAVDERRLAAVYNMADIFVMPSRREEMFGMAAVEAQACGKPVVASDHGGLREVVPPSCGLRFPVDDVEALASCIEQLLDNPPLYQQLASHARGNALRFDWPAIQRRADAIYGNLVAPPL